MVSAPPRPKPRKVEKEKPWQAYTGDTGNNYLLLEPGWGGQLGDDELGYILEHLTADAALAAWWGFRPKAKRRPHDAINRVAEHGDADDQSHNRRLARLRSEMRVAGLESLVSARVQTVRSVSGSSRPPG